MADAISAATRAAVTELFRERLGERFYYCALITTGDAVAPVLCAWSEEALEATARRLSTGSTSRDELMREIRWSYADSRYYAYGEAHFDVARSLWSRLGRLDSRDPAAWERGFKMRLDAMVAAIKQLDAEGLSGVGEARRSIVVNVECMPPDRGDVERAMDLNPPEALTEWLAEAAESEEST
ncbi:DUF4303 domain-containing protein [Sandaracinus amylolyticus]|uniref:DUF4303 domain-containing protein n=1 Tax=Sandaracinus amylolyticus TaxID=927083 RepID=UPI001F351C05|nr:DUF4303 domain-containing protein [Sandaracinus amylolyticus]